MAPRQQISEIGMEELAAIDQRGQAVEDDFIERLDVESGKAGRSDDD